MGNSAQSYLHDLFEREELKTQNAEWRTVLSERESKCDRLDGQLRAELSARLIEREELKGRINSIQGSICWRLTGPIRWLHKQMQFRPGKKAEGRSQQGIPGE
jgi:hypothetical protein